MLSIEAINRDYDAEKTAGKIADRGIVWEMRYLHRDGDGGAYLWRSLRWQLRMLVLVATVADYETG